MLKIGLIREGKTPADNRVAFTPAQCKWIGQHVPDVTIAVQPSLNRCFTDEEYKRAGVGLQEDLSACEVLLGIKEVPEAALIPGKHYCFFSHTKKMQPYNRGLMQEMVRKKITLTDYECLEHDDGQRIIGFGFFAGVVGAHNGMMAYGNRTGAFRLDRVGGQKDYRHLIHTYFGMKLPPVRIAVTGSGRVAHGVIEVMNLMDVQEVEPEDYLSRDFNYPVFVQLKGASLFGNIHGRPYRREHFHSNPAEYRCLFPRFAGCTDILMNGVYWEPGIPRLFEWSDMEGPDFRIVTIADITDDPGGSVPCNTGDSDPAQPVYGIDVPSRSKTAPYTSGQVDVMAVGNLPNELPRDASSYFGEQLIKHVLPGLIQPDKVIRRATILENGRLTDEFNYLADYAACGAGS